MINKLNDYIWSMCIENKEIQKLKKEIEEQEERIVKMQEKVTPQIYAFYIEKTALNGMIISTEKEIESLKEDNDAKNEVKASKLKATKQSLNKDLKKLIDENKSFDEFCKKNDELLKKFDDINKKYDSLNEKYIEAVSNFEQLICNFKKEFDNCSEMKTIEELEKEEKQVGVHWMYGPMLLEETKDNCLVYKVLFPQYISKYVSKEDRKTIIKKYPLEATGFSLFAYGNPIKHFSFLYSDK